MYVLRDKKTNKPLYLSHSEEGLKWATDSRGRLLYFKQAKLIHKGEKVDFEGDLKRNPEVYVCKFKKVYHKSPVLNKLEDRFYDLSEKYI